MPRIRPREPGKLSIRTLTYFPPANTIEHSIHQTNQQKCHYWLCMHALMKIDKKTDSMQKGQKGLKSKLDKLTEKVNNLETPVNGPKE